MTRDTVKFLILCLIWGSTWLAIKHGVDAVPPLLFAGTRFAAAGAVILGLAYWRGKLPKVARRDWPRLFVVTGLMIPLCYGPLFWGMLYVDSGMAAVLELSLTPVALLAFALLLGDERFDVRRILAIALGVAGVCILFAPEIYSSSASTTDQVGHMRLLGSFAVAAAAVVYAYGSVLARPLLVAYPADFIAGFTTLCGGAMLMLSSIALEPASGPALWGDWGSAWASWLFLVLFGSLIGYTLFMQLLRDIGASRAGAYAFVSPVIAVLLGMLTLGEKIGIIEVAGMTIMLCGAYLAIRLPEKSMAHAPDSAGERPGRSPSHSIEERC